MNRILFTSEELSPDGIASFDDARAEHVLNVLHGSVGQVLKTGVVDGPIGTATIESIAPLPPNPETGAARGRITVRCRHDAAPLAPWIDIILAPPRPRAFKRLLPQLAALGVGNIVLVGAEKVEKAFWGAQVLRPEIYRPLFIDGLMQSGTTAMPAMRIEKSFRRYVESGRLAEEFASRPCFVAHPADEISAIGASAAVRGDGRIVLAIGPEGGWTDGEVALLESLGFRRISLGARILRTDTALIALIARLMA